MNIKNVVRYSVAAVLGFLTVIVPAAFANTTNLSFDASYATGPFVFYCEPYMATFTAGGLYTPIDGSCAFSIPVTITGSGKVIALYKGTPGNATAVSGDAYFGLATLVQEDFSAFGSPTQGDNFFAAIFDLNLYTGLNSYFQSGGLLPAGAVENLNYYVMQWKWGVPDTSAPTITIETPQDGATYFFTDTVLASTTIIDVSPIATSTYRFNNEIINPTLPLPLTGVLLGSSSLSVTATDIFGNTASATSTFNVASPDSQAPTITITSPQSDATYFDTATLYLTATISDASAIAATSYAFNGVTVDPLLPLPILGAPLGPATVSVAATDIYGNASLSTLNFIIKSSDILPPTITITNPIAGHTYFNTNSVMLVSNIIDPSGISASSYMLNDTEINPAFPLPLTTIAAGPASVTVSATDAFGNATSTSVSFIVTAPPPSDGQGPVITIISPVQGKLYLRSNKVYIIATFADQSSVTSVKYYFNGVKVDSNLPLPFNKAPLGTSTVVVKAKDRFGNMGYATSTFSIIPGHGSCIKDITEAFEHKKINNKNMFTQIFQNCKVFEHWLDDRDHGDHSHDDDIDDISRDFNRNIGRGDDDDDQGHR